MASYGSENPEQLAFMRRISSIREAKTKKTMLKKAVAALGVTVLAGVALQAYQSNESGWSLNLET